MSLRNRLAGTRTPVIAGVAATVAVIAAGGVFWAASADSDPRPSSDQRDQAVRAAVEEVGGGRAIDVEVDDDTDDGGIWTYDVEVAHQGRVHDVLLDEDFTVLTVDVDDAGSRGDRDGDGDRDDRDDDGAEGESSATDPDDTPIDEAQRARITEIAESEVTGGRVTEIDRDTDDAEHPTQAFEVELDDEAGQEWVVRLDDELAVLQTARD